MSSNTGSVLELLLKDYNLNSEDLKGCVMYTVEAVIQLYKDLKNEYLIASQGH